MISNELKINNKGTGAGGANTTLNGSLFEERTSIENKLLENKFIKKEIDTKTKNKKDRLIHRIKSLHYTPLDYGEVQLNYTGFIFEGNYPIYNYDYVFNNDVKLLGDKSLGLIGKFLFNTTFDLKFRFIKNIEHL